MKDNKLYKILRMIFLALAIISLVFTLCKKVGLCASVNPPSLSSEIFPLPIGVGYGYNSNNFIYSSEVNDAFINKISTDSSSSYLFNDSTYGIYLICMNEFDLSNNRLYVNVYGWKSGRVSFSVNSSTYAITSTGSGADYYLWRCSYDFDDQTVTMSYQGSYPWSFSPYGNGRPFEDSPSGNGFVFNGNHDFYGYPLFADLTLTDTSGNLLFEVPQTDSGINFENGEVTSLPSFDPLPGIVNPSDDQQTLFDKLKGWLSTLSGNIQKGFKNIEENLTSFFKPYLDNIKGFFDWVTEPFDPEAAKDELEAIQVVSDIISLNNVVGSAGIFDWDDVTPASRVAFTFDFGGAVLPHHQYEINFDWYTGTTKTLILSILVTFLVVGLLVTIINNIPSMIHGHSGDTGGGSN